MILLFILAQIEISTELGKEYVNKTMTIGDPFEIMVVAKYPPGTRISEPFVDSLEPFFLIDQKSGSVEERGMVSNTYRIKMVPFGTGELRIPSFRFLVQREDKVDTLSSNEIDLKVAGVMPEEMQDINDLKKAVEFPNFLPLIIASILILGLVLGYLAYRYMRRLNRLRSVPKPRPPAWAEAIAVLEGMPVDEWLAKGFFKKYYYTISETLKHYLERRFSFRAAEQTTTEIVANLKAMRIPQRDEFDQFFTRADMVKYAKHVPPDDEMKTAVRVAIDLVMKTKPEEPAAEEE
jgi:hypothetical protein